MLVVKGKPFDPLEVEWYSLGKVVYTVEGNVKVGTQRSARIAKDIVRLHNATL